MTNWWEIEPHVGTLIRMQGEDRFEDETHLVFIREETGYWKLTGSNISYKWYQVVEHFRRFNEVKLTSLYGLILQRLPKVV